MIGSVCPSARCLVRSKFVDRLLFLIQSQASASVMKILTMRGLEPASVISPSRVGRFLRLQSDALIELPGIHHGLGV